MQINVARAMVNTCDAMIIEADAKAGALRYQQGVASDPAVNSANIVEEQELLLQQAKEVLLLYVEAFTPLQKEVLKLMRVNNFGVCSV